MKANSILDTIGHTPHIRINRLFGATMSGSSLNAATLVVRSKTALP
jgi:hypothetical protein